MADDFESPLMNLVRGGKASPELINQINEAIHDSRRMEELTAVFRLGSRALRASELVVGLPA
jgi:hypothetical protein